MEEEFSTIMRALSTLSSSNLTHLTQTILTLFRHHRRRLSAVLSSSTLFSLSLHHLLSLSLPHKILLIARHLLSLLQPLLLHLRFHHHPSTTTSMRLRDLDSVVFLLFLCETHQLDPDALEASPDNWQELLRKLYSDTMLNDLSGIWTCNAGILMPYIETLSRCRRFIEIMGGGERGGGGGGGGGVGKEGKEVAAARAAVMALRTVEVAAGSTVECVICKEEMREGRDVCEMPCKHLFHWKCILPWLSKTNTCPFCRFQLPTDDVFGEIQRLWELLIKASGDQ